MKYWYVKTKYGIICEKDEVKWNEINDIERLHLDNDGQIISLPENMEKYYQAKTASAMLGSNEITIESRFLAFKLGNNIIKVRVNEKTNNISIEVEKENG